MRVLIALSLAVCSLSATAQTAQVIALTPDEAKEVRALYTEQDEVANKLKALQSQIKLNHVAVDPKDPDAGNVGASINEFVECDNLLDHAPCAKGKIYAYRKGWENGFEFSTDFKYIVPLPAPQYTVTKACNPMIYYNNGDLFTSPAISPGYHVID